MTPRLVLWVLFALGALWTAAWAFVLLRSRPGAAFEVIEPVENRLRLRLLLIFSTVGLVVFALTLHAYPYPRAGTYTVRCLEYCGIFHHIMLTTFTVR